MKRTFFYCLIFCFFGWIPSNGQMLIDGDTLFGNEWINYDQNYAKIAVLQDGIHSISFDELDAAGVFAGASVPNGANLQLFHMGQEIPIYVNDNGTLGSGDYIEFYGNKNRGAMDKHLYIEPEYHLNPENSIFTDTAAYFLTWNNSTNNARFSEVAYDGSALPPAESYCFKTVVSAFFNQWQKGKRHGGNNARYSDYDIAEGWTASRTTSKSTDISTSGVYTSGPDAQVSTRFLTEDGTHNIDITVEGASYINETFNDWSVKEYSFDVPVASIDENTNVIVAGTNSADDKVGVSFVKIRYPKIFDFDNASTFEFELPADANNKKYLEISNFNHAGNAPILYDLTSGLKIETLLSGNTVLAVVPPSSQNRQLVLVNTNDYKNAVDVTPRNFVDFLSLGGDYIIVSNALLYDDGLGNNYVQEYADYRSGTAGGSFNVVLAEVYQLYDQYAYGVNRHEMSVKNFTEQQIRFGNIEYLYLVGNPASFSQMHNVYKSGFMVPTYGHPTTDHIFATDKGDFVPKIPVGRLAAQTPDHVRIYLDKVKEYEANLSRPQTIEERAWMKHVIHLGGGDAGIQDLIKGELNDMKDVVENGKFGGKVFSFFKTSTDVVQEAPTEQIKQLIDDGASLVTFFGHSAPSTLDFDLEDPAAYDNHNGKYPIIYAIGCHTCRFAEYDGTLSEQWVLAEDRGSIAYLGATWETTLSNLSAYAKDFYQNYGEDNYGQRLGDVIVATINDFDLSTSFFAEQLKQVNILHGDPGLKLNNHDAPDYLVNTQKVGTEPVLLNTQMEKFDFNYSIANIGSAVTDSIAIRIDYEYPDGKIDSLTTIETNSPGYESAITTSINLPKIKSLVGFNKLHIDIDPLNAIEEAPDPVAEMNNKYEYPFYILANDAFPVYPYEYSIINSPNPRLKASTANAFAETSKYYLEIDTTTHYNSPIKRETVLNESGGVIEWQPAIPYIDNTVYYWRISIDSVETAGDGFNWHESSFLYKEASSDGWNQSHFFQLKKDNDLDGLDLLSNTRKLSYEIFFNELKMRNGVSQLVPSSDITPVLNGGLIQDHKSCTTAGIDVAVLDSCTLFPWQNPPGGDFGSFNCKQYDFQSYPFKTGTVEEREDLINFLENIVPDNSYVLLWTIQRPTTDYLPEEWALDSVSNSFQKNIYQVLEEQGATKVRQLEITGSVPYFFVYRKNDPSFLETLNYSTEVIAPDDTSTIESLHIIENSASAGILSSTTIGPARAWQSLLWNMEDYQASIDKVDLNIYGIDLNDNETLLHQSISVFDTTLNHIDAQLFPYLRLDYVAKDSISKTVPHLDYWRVLYDPVPEAALRPDLYLSFKSDTLQQGEELSIDIAVENISEVNMDSLLVHYTVIDQNNNTALTGTRMAPLLKGDTLQAHLSFDTRNINTPINQLIVEVNPDNDQLEQYHFNNIAVKQFNIILDEKNPLLDVTFDGVHIMDGDIVSAKPLINIVLKDENLNLALNDSSMFRMKLLFPNETQARDVFMSDEGVTFYPADESNLDKENKARVELRQFFQEDGVYELSIRAEDRTGNDSGEYDYKVRFEVINEARVSNVLNYPNPFSTSTQFVFTLTGSDVPDFMKIQIMSVSGKIIREITQDELGPIHVGKNITEFRWDGTDQYGDRLANGVYLYRVVTREANGEEYKKHNTNTNQFFKNGFGKMVILR